MAYIRDPSFWRRFSLAVHRAEEKELQQHQRQHLQEAGTRSPSSGSSSIPMAGTPPPSYAASISAGRAHIQNRE
jgi:hypothetical protein